MSYIAEENDVKDTVFDFIKFCDFIDAKKPFATQKGDLSVKACYEINQILLHPVKNAKNTDRMYQYSSVSLWFLIAREAGLISCSSGGGGKNVYITTETYHDFKKMNIFSQYLLIFNTWFCFVDIGAQYKERGTSFMLGSIIDGFFSQLSEHGYTQWMQKENYHYKIFDSNPVQFMIEHYYKTAHTLMDLGLLIFEEGDELSTYHNYPVIKRIKPTRFGVCIMKACECRKHSWFNVYADNGVMIDESETYEKTMESVETEDEAFLAPFLSCFPEGSIDLAAINVIIYGYEDAENDKRVFEFRVSLNKKCYRIIRCLPTHTFEALHLAIQEAFEFDNDHLYSFYLDAERYSNYAVNAPYSENPPYTDEVCLNDVRLRDKQQILYLFDYGDQWEFDIVVNVKTESVTNLKKPEIIKKVGRAPEQYPDYEEY